MAGTAKGIRVESTSFFGTSVVLIGLCCVLCVAAPSLAATPQLFKDVDVEKAQKLSTYNERFVKGHLYFASRHRIVEVNSELLWSDDPVEISFFSDAPALRVRRLEPFQLHPQAGRGRWIGRVIEPVVDPSEIRAVDPPDAEVNQAEVWDLVTRISLGVTEWDVHRGSREATLAGQRAGQRNFGVIAPPDSTAEPPIEIAAFYAVSGEFWWAGATYRIQPLSFTPKYHLIYEVDPVKYLAPPEPFDESIAADEAREKVKEYQRHLQTLPDESGTRTVEEVP